MSFPCGHGEQLTALLFSLQKSFTYLRLVIMFPWRLLLSALNNCLSFAPFSCPFYFQVEWHMRSWFCILRSLSTLFNFFVALGFVGVPWALSTGSGMFFKCIALKWDQYCSWGLSWLRKAAGLFHVPGAWHFCLYNHGLFFYNIVCSCLQFCVPFPNQLCISHMEFHLDSIFLIF